MPPLQTLDVSAIHAYRFRRSFARLIRPPSSGFIISPERTKPFKGGRSGEDDFLSLEPLQAFRGQLQLLLNLSTFVIKLLPITF
jgi:hypothetical protein